MAQPKLRLVPQFPAQVSPVLKWAGSKRWFVRQHGEDLFDLVLSRGGRYIEPFLGGASMALYLGLEGMLLNDIEEDLVFTYVAIRDELLQLVALLDLLKAEGTDEKTYYRIRDAEPETSVEKAARLLYLNKFGFNGLFRKNKAGKFNVPYGKDPDRTLPTREEFFDISRVLQTADLFCGDFTNPIEFAEKGDTIYCDSPYDGTFSDYSAKGFDQGDQERLATALNEARNRGAAIVAHNADTQLVRDLYGWAEIVGMPEKRMINSDGAGRGEVPCVLIVAE